MNIDEVLPGILHDLLSYDESKHKRILEQYFNDNAKFSHPLLTVEGTYNIRRVFRVWTSLNAQEPSINESYVLDGQTAVVHTTQHFRPRIMPFVHLKVPATTTLKFRKTDKGNMEIYSQTESWTLEGLIQSVPLINWWYENVVRVLMGKLVSGAGSFLHTANQATTQLTTHAGEIRERSSEVIAPYSERATEFVAPYQAKAQYIINEGQNKVQGITTNVRHFLVNAQEEVISKIHQVRGIQPAYPSGNLITEVAH